MLDEQTRSCEEFDISQSINIRLTLFCKRPLEDIFGYIVIKNSNEDILIESDSLDLLPNRLLELTPGLNRFILKVSSNVLAIGNYTVYLSFASHSSDKFILDCPKEVLFFTVVDRSTRRGGGRTAKTSHLISWQPINDE
jgi:hypothetical protein